MFAILRIIMAVFIAETNRVAANDDEIALITRTRQKRAYIHKLKEVFRELDESGDGSLTREEFNLIFDDAVLKAWMSSLEVDVHDVRTLFDMLSGDKNKVDFEEFTEGLIRVRGNARSLDILELRYSLSRLGMKIEKLQQVCAVHPPVDPDIDISMIQLLQDPGQEHVEGQVIEGTGRVLTF